MRPDGSSASQSGFETKKAALNWGEEQEAGIRRHSWNDPRDGAALLADWVELWWSGQDLEATTEAKYRYLIDHHIVPAFGNRPVNTLTSPEEIVAWEKRTRTNGFSHRTAADARSLLGTILGDAKERGMVTASVAVKRRGRGRKRARRAIAVRGPEKVWATPLQTLLLAERCALLSGRDDDFVLIVLTAYTGLRWGEVHGLERRRADSTGSRSTGNCVSWQGGLRRCRPRMTRTGRSICRPSCRRSSRSRAFGRRAAAPVRDGRLCVVGADSTCSSARRARIIVVPTTPGGSSSPQRTADTPRARGRPESASWRTQRYGRGRRFHRGRMPSPGSRSNRPEERGSGW